MTQYSVSPSILNSDLSGIARISQEVLLRIRIYWRRHTSRQQLLELPEYRRRDLGLTQDQLTQEALKPFWR